MQVIFVSRCEKQALKKTRKILDAFADRIGDNSWRTLITKNGLVAVKAMLRKQATKNTAVSCHWIRSNNQHELLFIVGHRHKFNPITGVAPVNTTKKNLLTMDEDHDWHYLPIIKSLTGIAALLHDWGKSTVLFQQKLVNGSKKSDPVRHEWISTILFIAFVNSHTKDNTDDTPWLEQLAKGNIDEQNIINQLQKMQSLDVSYLQLPPIASIIAWLILSHHRLPINAAEKHRVECKEIKQLLAKITANWGYDNTWQGGDQQQRLQDCFKFQHGLLTESSKWLKQLKRYAQKLLSKPQHEDLIKSINNGVIRVILHHARLALMLGDHNFSSEDPKPNHKVIENTLYANTDKKSKQLKQQLDEHLIGVCQAASCIATMLPALENKLPASANIKKLIETSPKDYQWQDKAYKDIKKHRHQENNQHNGCFVVNIASTGTGKTFANAKIMLALNPENKLRYSLALGLRTLTLQTGDEYKEKIKLDDSELATLIGSQTIEELHASAKEDNKPTTNEQLGSESAEEIFDGRYAEEDRGEDIDFPELDADIDDHVKAKITTTLRTDKQKKLLYSPVVVCTIDHLIQATENTKSKYILPSLRLMSSDLVIDEIDDFTGDDLVAISRLVFLAAMLGRKVVLSSATIPPDLAKNYFRIYQQGWLLYAKTRHANKSIDCIWVDEFNTDIATIVSEDSETACKEYQQKHNKFIDKRLKKLVIQEAKRKAKIIYVDNITDKYDTGKKNYYFQLIAETCQQLHQDYYGIDDQTKLKISFGVVRMANIAPAVALTKFLLDYQLEDHTAIRVMVYHSNQTLLLRSVQEKHLDAVLKTARKENPQEIYNNKIIRNHLDYIHKAQPKTKNVLFILVASPAIEVGRDHDYDWGIIEPSSARSITQTSGRVVRHRYIICDKPNIAILQYNFKALKNNNPEKDICFKTPGYENKVLKLNNHDLTKIIDIKQLEEKIDASWRISKPLVSKDRKPKENLAHLEHAATNMILRKVYSPKLNKTYKNDINGPNQINGYIDEAWYLTGCSQKFIPFRKQTGTQIKICLIYNAEGNKKNYFASYDNKGKLVVTDNNKPVESDITSKIEPYSLTEKQQQRLWLKLDFNQELTEYLNNHELTYNKYQYGDLTSYEYDQYQYCDQFGLIGIVEKELEDC
jgi:CRISPR-associated endonuclease/helicase Cas3